MESQKNVAIIGGGRRGTAILETLKDDAEVKIVCVVDINPNAPALQLAKRLNIPIAYDFIEFLSTHDSDKIDVIFNATGEMWVQEEIKKKAPQVEIVGGISLKLVWGLIAERERALALQRDLYRSTIGILSVKLESEKLVTGGHPELVTMYATLLGRYMNLDPIQLEVLKCAAILHDIGKFNIPDEILLKTSKLTTAEYEIIKRHPIESENIVKSMDFLYAIWAAIKYHHERYDGKGYPEGLEGEKIPLTARILAVCDSFAAMTSDRPYGKAKTIPEAEEELKRCAGTQFDPTIVKAFTECLQEKIYKEKEITKEASK